MSLTIEAYEAELRGLSDEQLAGECRMREARNTVTPWDHKQYLVCAAEQRRRAHATLSKGAE